MSEEAVLNQVTIIVCSGDPKGEDEITAHSLFDYSTYLGGACTAGPCPGLHGVTHILSLLLKLLTASGVFIDENWAFGSGEDACMRAASRRKLWVFRSSLMSLLSRDPSQRPSMAKFCATCNRVLAGSTTVPV